MNRRRLAVWLLQDFQQRTGVKLSPNTQELFNEIDRYSENPGSNSIYQLYKLSVRDAGYFELMKDNSWDSFEFTYKYALTLLIQLLASDNTQIDSILTRIVGAHRWLYAARYGNSSEAKTLELGLANVLGLPLSDFESSEFDHISV